MPRRLLIPTALLIALAAPAAASAAYEYTDLRSTGLSAGDCLSVAAAGAAGVRQETWTAAAEGHLSVRIGGAGEGPDGDWDLAIFGPAGGEALAASTAFGPDEQATLWVERGERILVQACRLDPGAPAQVGLSLDLTEMALPEPSAETFTLEQVPLAGAGALDRLRATGLDVTDAVDGDSAVVATYSDAERQALAAAGFAATTIEDNLLARDARSRRIERRDEAVAGVSALPSGRESYRQYVDFTSDMKALADAHPDVVEPLVIGETLEGRPIQGLEIAAGAGDPADGRPVYLNMGAHHAREWPSAELPMEFAITLAEGYGSDPRITALLDRVRVVIVPIVNVDGFIASRSFGTSPLDDDGNATIPQALANQGAYIRKNCRPTLSDGAVPCAMRTGSGVDPNRNYGAYWGGEGASTDPSSQGYRGTAPFSEPETAAMQAFMSELNPIINITNHTYTVEGQWLREPGFTDPEITGPDDETPDEDAMAALGAQMAAATGWESNKSIILGNITGATEDWNYYVQSAYGYTPEGRGPNFHGTYSNVVVTEYEGDATHAGLGVREAYLRAGEFIADPAQHSVIEGEAPAGATLKLVRNYDTPTYQPGLTVPDHLELTLKVPDSGRYEWHVGPSSRPLESGEAYTMRCRPPGAGDGEVVTDQVVIGRGQRKTVDWTQACRAAGPGPGPKGARCKGEATTIAGSPQDETLRGTKGRDVIAARGGDDRIRGRGGADVICGGSGDDKARGGRGGDLLAGGAGEDVLRAGKGADTLRGSAGEDVLRGGGGRDSCRAGSAGERLSGCETR